MLMQRIMRILASLFGGLKIEGHSKPRVPPLFPASVTLDRVEKKLNEFASSPTWDWTAFRGVLICLAKMGEGTYLPTGQTPDRVYLDGLQPTFADLRRLSAERQGRETSRVV